MLQTDNASSSGAYKQYKQYKQYNHQVLDRLGETPVKGSTAVSLANEFAILAMVATVRSGPSRSHADHMQITEIAWHSGTMYVFRAPMLLPNACPLRFRGYTATVHPTSSNNTRCAYEF